MLLHDLLNHRIHPACIAALIVLEAHKAAAPESILSFVLSFYNEHHPGGRILCLSNQILKIPCILQFKRASCVSACFFYPPAALAALWEKCPTKRIQVAQPLLLRKNKALLSELFRICKQRLVRSLWPVVRNREQMQEIELFLEKEMLTLSELEFRRVLFLMIGELNEPGPAVRINIRDISSVRHLLFNLPRRDAIWLLRELDSQETSSQFSSVFSSEDPDIRKLFQLIRKVANERIYKVLGAGEQCPREQGYEKCRFAGLTEGAGAGAGGGSPLSEEWWLFEDTCAEKFPDIKKKASSHSLWLRDQDPQKFYHLHRKFTAINAEAAHTIIEGPRSYLIIVNSEIRAEQLHAYLKSQSSPKEESAEAEAQAQGNSSSSSSYFEARLSDYLAKASVTRRREKALNRGERRMEAFLLEKYVNSTLAHITGEACSSSFL